MTSATTPTPTDLTLPITSMTCGGCVRSVTAVLQALPGVASVQVTLEPGQAEVRFDAAQVTPAQLRAAVEDAGFDIPA
jgi:copper chaperone